MACKEHVTVVSKIERNGAYIRFGIGLVSLAFAIVMSIFAILNSYAKESAALIGANSVSISRQAGAFEQISKQLDRIERKIK